MIKTNYPDNTRHTSYGLDESNLTVVQLPCGRTRLMGREDALALQHQIQKEKVSA